MKNKHTSAIFTILVAFLLLLAVAAPQEATAFSPETWQNQAIPATAGTQAQTAGMHSDAMAVPADVKNTILKANRLSLLNTSVNTKDGVIPLSGKINSTKQAELIDTFALTAGIAGPAPPGKPAQNAVPRMRGATAKGRNKQPYNKTRRARIKVSTYHLNRCAEFVGNAIEASGVPLNRGLNPTPKNSAFGYGPVLENAGFRIMPKGTTAQAGDVAIFPPIPNHPHGHATMFDGQIWRSDFKQKDIYAGSGYRNRNAPYTLYRRP